MNKHPIHIHTHIDVYDRQSSVTQFFINHTSLVARRTPTHTHTHITEFIIQCQTKQNKKCRIFLVLHNCDRFQFQFFFRFWFFSNDTIIPFLLFHGNWFFLFSFFLIWFDLKFCTVFVHMRIHTHTHTLSLSIFFFEYNFRVHFIIIFSFKFFQLHYLLIIYIDYYYYNKYSVH